MNAMSQTSYWAHSTPNAIPGSDSRTGWQLLSDHLEAVARLARELAFDTRPTDERFVNLAGLTGVLHDFGKYTECFQQMLKTGKGRCQHAIHGAMLAYFGADSRELGPKLNTVMAAIAGHHAGLADWSDFKGKLSESRYRREVQEILARASADCRELGLILPSLESVRDVSPGPRKARFDLLVRMLFSCLVDADHLDTGGRARSGEMLCADGRLQSLLKHIADLQEHSPDGPVKAMRAQVLEDP